MINSPKKEGQRKEEKSNNRAAAMIEIKVVKEKKKKEKGSPCFFSPFPINHINPPPRPPDFRLYSRPSSWNEIVK